MEPTRELINELYAEDVRDARRLAPEVKLRLGAELFDYACTISKAGIRHQHPHADEAQVFSILCERVRLGERLERSL